MNVSRFQLKLARMVSKRPQLAQWLGDIETSWLRDHLANIHIDRPIYVTGLPCSGTTTIVNLLAQVQGVATHRSKDFPFVHTPYWWNHFLSRNSVQDGRPQADKDHQKASVPSESPEAMEELLWMTFFPRCHDPRLTNVFTKHLKAPTFEAFYNDHIRKILMLRQGLRYLSKGHYNITRMQYLQSLFPEARFIVTICEPVSHIASLINQHQHFCEQEALDPLTIQYMQLAGRYEFGLDRRPIHCGDVDKMANILSMRRRGREIEGWAAYWAMVHHFLVKLLQKDQDLAERCMVISYETLYSDPVFIFENILEHCDLDVSICLFEQFLEQLSPPTEHQMFSQQEVDIVQSETRSVYSELEKMMDRQTASFSRPFSS